MKLFHAPKVNARYWTAITLASVFGTNLGDYYAHESGLGILGGLVLLAVLTAAVFVAEHFENMRHQVYYWLVIIIIRTGATNIADYMAGRRGMHLPEPWLSLSWAAFIAIFGWFTHSALRAGESSPTTLPKTTAPYWLAMLGCGVFGTIVGDICSKQIGEGPASIALFALFLAILLAGGKKATQVMAIYWGTVAVARTAGTAIGDFFAEGDSVHIGWGYAALISGTAFAAVLLFWKSAPDAAQLTPAAAESDAD